MLTDCDCEGVCVSELVCVILDDTLDVRVKVEDCDCELDCVTDSV